MKPVIIIAIAFVLFIPSNVFAQEYLISVQTDDTHYFKGDKIVVSGNVYPLIEDSFVSINLFLVDGGAIAVDLVTPHERVCNRYLYWAGEGCET